MEVGPRDGLQSENVIVDTPSKLAFISGLSRSGLSRIEITAFVSPKWIPSLADQLEVARGIKRAKGVSYAALVPNMKGYERALDAKVDEIAFVLAASNSHNKKNINATTSEAFVRYQEVADRAQADEIPFRAYVSCAFGCPYEGDIPIKSVTEIAKKFIELGAYEISIGDTIGVGNPVQTDLIVNELAQAVSLSKIALHMHDTRGLALANILMALELGVASFDSSAGGLGGCPYAPGASGNVASEDLIYMLHEMGIETGVDLNSLCKVSKKMQKLLGRRLPSKVLAACG